MCNFEKEMKLLMLRQYSRIFIVHTTDYKLSFPLMTLYVNFLVTVEKLVLLVVCKMIGSDIVHSANFLPIIQNSFGYG